MADHRDKEAIGRSICARHAIKRKLTDYRNSQPNMKEY